ncbi:patatin-like phospholipase family protein [Ammoniphilus resinae]|uniref:NTE family protein n=1 Tax=Ammoniphilus resinae TaxID=861532 RepID=A0ABS4GUS3_9BACL|nr:patatin-like phospholipase family protein [Ammoniphilus resinae]MBP1933625.1 NTE family protein [Ammoniphilus resinae]
MRVNAIFEGGGIRGLAFLGAIEQMEAFGYEWGQLAGTSAGSIMATLLAAGYKGKEITERLLQFPFNQIEKKTGIGKFPLFGPWLCLAFHNGLYNPIILEQWIHQLLREKGITTFADLPPNKLKVTITDLTANRMSILPDDLAFYQTDPATFPVATAVRMSCSIPYILRPLKLNGNVIVDGAVLSKYPIWIFDTTDVPKWPTFGFRLSGPEFIQQPKKIAGPLDLSIALIRTMMDFHDQRHLDSHSAVRTIFIKGIKLRTTDFYLTEEDKLELIELGRKSTQNFLRDWNFQKYIQTYWALDKVVNLNTKGGYK